MSLYDIAGRVYRRSALALAIAGAACSPLAVALMAHGSATDVTAPYLALESPTNNNAIVRNPQLAISGYAYDDESGLATVTCDGVTAVVDDGAFTCTKGLSPGANVIAILATDLALNTATHTFTVIFDTSLSVSPDTPVSAQTSSLVTLEGNVLGPTHKPRTYTWTQISGPTVALRGAETPNVSFVTPPQAVAVILQLDVANDVASSSGQVQVNVEDLSTTLNLTAFPTDEHESTLEVGSTSLRSGFVWPGPGHALVVTLTASDAATLDATAVTAPLTIELKTATSLLDVTSWFTYDAPSNTLSLASAEHAAFKGLLTDAMMTLGITGMDDSGRPVALSIPLQSGRFTVTGMLDAPSGTSAAALGQTLVLLEGNSRRLRAVATATSGGSFVFDGLYADDYTVTAIGPDGLVGTESMRLNVAAADAQTITVPLLDWSGSSNRSAARGGEMGISNVNTELQASPFEPASQTTVIVPQGTPTIHLSAGLGASGITEEFGFEYAAQPGHACEVVARLNQPWYPVIDNQYSYGVMLNGQLVASGQGSYCTTAMPDFSHASLLDKVVDVSGATADGDAEIRLFARSSEASSFGTHGRLGVSVMAPAGFAITSVHDVDGSHYVKRLKEVSPPFYSSTFKLLGVPPATAATHNKFGLRIAYQPADAETLEVKVSAMHIGGPIEELNFSQSTPAQDGIINLTDVGFPTTSSRPLFEAKRDDIYIVAEVRARLPDQSEVTKTAVLGVDVLTRQEGRRLVPLYDTSVIPGAAARRFSGREASWGGDGWARRRTFGFLMNQPHILFNDLSLEHGGKFPPHGLHQHGTSIDTRYLGAGGAADPLNGQAGDTLASFRHNRLTAAMNGDAAAQRDIVDWIRQNRDAIDALASEPALWYVYYGKTPWNLLALLWGQYENGQPIKDPQTQQEVGSWAPLVVVVAAGGHLDHLHFEMWP